MRYKRGYKYQLVEDLTVTVPFSVEIRTEYIEIKRSVLTIKSGYAWDGATLAIDTKNFMRGSLVHDALYQLLRTKQLSQSTRTVCDRLLQQICIEDGMSKFRAWYVYHAVRLWGEPSADPSNKKVVYEDS